MSWDADIGERCWNYTHNTNRMAAKVMETFGMEPAHAWFDGRDKPGTQWYVTLDGMTAEESLPFLDLIIGGLMEAPSMFREMNPDNGWGDYDSFLAVLVEMRAEAARCVVEDPTEKWQVSG